MEIPDYKPNSHKYKQEQREAAQMENERRVEKVVSGVAKTKKKSEARRFMDNFITEDAQSIKSYIVMDVIIPAIKNAILDTVEMILGGNGKKRKRSTLDRITYTDYSNPGRRYGRGSEETGLRSGGDFEDVIVDTKGEAEEVISQLEAIIETYKVARVTDLYDLVGLTAPYTGNRYGWTNLHTAESIRLRDGSYMIKLPRAMPID